MRLTKLDVNSSLMELSQHGAIDFPLEYYVDELNNYETSHVPWHWHRELEFFTVTEGTVACSIGNIHFNLEVGDGLFVNSGILHKYEPKNAHENTVAKNIVFAPEFIAPISSRIFSQYISPILSNHNISYYVFKGIHNWENDIMRNLDQIYDFCENKLDIYELKVHALTNEIWQSLYEHRNKMQTASTDINFFTSQIRIKQMLQYIEENYSNEITLNDIALSANISKSEALRCFKNCLDCSPIKYLIRFRINEAVKLLLIADKSISEIATQCGFEDTSYFNRMFKKELNITPGEYRKRLKQS